MKNLEKHLNALMAIVISLVLFGALIIQFFVEEPCPLCLMQRLGMIGVAIGALLNLKFGIHKIHYGLSLLSSLIGGFIAARQIALHICPGFSQFGMPFWGLSLYTWSFLVFVLSVAYIALLLVFFDQKTASKGMNWWDKLAIVCVFLAAAINIFTTFQTCGFGPCSEAI